MNAPPSIHVRQTEGNAIKAALTIRVMPEEESAPTKRRYRGEVYGPLASDRTTLPASYPLPTFSEGEEIQAIVTDPCFWSLESPLEYEIVLTPFGESGDALKKIIRLRPRSELT